MSDSPSEGVRKLSAVAAVGFALLLFLFKLKVFLGLGYSLDLFMQTQLATSWMDGRFLHDNLYGNHLGTHTYLLLPALGIFARPLGAIGLLLALSLSGGLALHLAFLILRERGMPPMPALAFAILIVAAPFSIHTLHDWQYGFHVELLEPALALGLWLALLRNNIGAIGAALAWSAALIAVKEDAPLLAGTLAVMMTVEAAVARWRGGLRGRALLHRGALAVLALSIAALPLLLLLIKANAPGATQGGAMARLPLAHDAGVRSYPQLARFILARLPEFVLSPQSLLVILAVAFASFGALVLRPHFIPLLLPFALVAWLQSDDPLWASRFAPALAIAWCIGLTGIASVWRAATERLRAPSARAQGFVAAAVGIAAIAGSIAVSLGPAGAALDFYTFAPWTYYTAEERADADALFARYRAEGRRDEPVIAHVYLFRYAHDRDLYWFYSAPAGLKPQWILWDEKAPPFSKWGFDPNAYECLGRRGRFGLYRRISAIH